MLVNRRTPARATGLRQDLGPHNGPAPFASDRDRVEHLFGRYEALVNPLERLGAAKNARVAKKAAQSVDDNEKDPR